MGLIPVSAAAAVPGVPAGRSRASVKGPAPASLARSHGPARAGGPTSGTPAKDKAGFASVLEAVQQEEPAGAGRSGQAPRKHVERDDDVPAEIRHERVVVDAEGPRAGESPAPAAAQTPWLLLALGSGSRSWQDGPSTEEPTGEEVRAVDEVQSDAVPGGASVASAVLVSPAGSALMGPAADTGVDLPSLASATAVDVTLAPSTGTVSSGPREPVVTATPAALPDAASTPALEAGAAVQPGLETEGSFAARAVQTVTVEAAGTPAPSTEGAADTSLDGTVRPQVPAPTEQTPALPAPTAAGETQVQSARPTSGPAARAASWASAASRQTPAIGAESERHEAAPALATAVKPAGTRVALPVEELPSAAPGMGRRAPEEGAMPAPLPPPPLTLTVPEAAVVPAPIPLADAVGQQVLDQVVTSVRLQWKDGIGEARLQLRPDSLGTVNVSLKVEAGAVTAVVRADSPEVQEWVVRHQDTLRQQLEAAGLNLAELVVSPDGRNEGRHQAPPQQRHRRQAMMAAQRKRFEDLL